MMPPIEGSITRGNPVDGPDRHHKGIKSDEPATSDTCPAPAADYSRNGPKRGRTKWRSRPAHVGQTCGGW
jgi:hypothetical protein